MRHGGTLERAIHRNLLPSPQMAVCAAREERARRRARQGEHGCVRRTSDCRRERQGQRCCRRASPHAQCAIGAARDERSAANMQCVHGALVAAQLADEHRRLSIGRRQQEDGDVAVRTTSVESLTTDGEAPDVLSRTDGIGGARVVGPAWRDGAPKPARYCPHRLRGTSRGFHRMLTRIFILPG